MDKKTLVRFLKAKKRGVYHNLVHIYTNEISGMSVVMALEIITEDIERETGERVELNYFSLAKAVKYLKSNVSKSIGQTKKWDFKDSSELPKDYNAPGKFK
jgi:hypothetical protein